MNDYTPGGSPQGTYADLGRIHTPQQSREEALAKERRDRDNLNDNLAEQALVGNSVTLIEWVRENFHAESNFLVCNRCSMTVTWLTKHAKERHGDPVQVVARPGFNPEGELW